MKRKKTYIKIETPTTPLETLKAVILKCYNINKAKNFENIKVQLIGNETLIKKIKNKLKLLDFIDHESEVFKSLYNLGKKTLEEELKTQKYEYWYHYLIHYLCDLELEKIVAKKSRKVEFFPTEKKRNQDHKSRFLEPEPKFYVSKEGGIIVNPKYTGKQLQREKLKHEDLKENLNLD